MIDESPMTNLCNVHFVNFDEYFALKSHDYTLFQASNQNTSQADSPLAGLSSRISAKAVIGPEARPERQPNTPGFIHCIVILIFFSLIVTFLEE